MAELSTSFVATKLRRSATMHAQRIIQDLLQTECGAIHAKRRVTLALMVQASCIGHLSLIGISRRLDTATALRHRIKRCDRLLGNLHLSHEKLDANNRV